MIQLDNLGMSYELDYGCLDVLCAVDLEIAAGETVAIVGPSGSGKTTLLVLLAGLEQPASGTVWLDGRSLGELDDDELADLRRDHIGIVFQSFHLVPSLTALGNVAYCPAANSSASRLRARWYILPDCYWPTSQPATSICAPGKPSSTCCSASTPTPVRPWCW
jgi:putative ABC transport system ATP-binding protein